VKIKKYIYDYIGRDEQTLHQLLGLRMLMKREKDYYWADYIRKLFHYWGYEIIDLPNGLSYFDYIKKYSNNLIIEIDLENYSWYFKNSLPPYNKYVKRKLKTWICNKCGQAIHYLPTLKYICDRCHSTNSYFLVNNNEDK
jgi:hypothetical protein